MKNESIDIKHDFRFGYQVALVAVVLFVISGFALTAGRGLEDESFKNAFILYSALGGAGILYHLGVVTYNYLTKKRGLRVIIHEPEESVLGSLKFVRNPLLLLLLFLILFTLPLFFVGKFSNTFFSAIPHAFQQITTSSSIWADSIFPALAENAFTFIIVSFMYSWNWFANRSNKGLYYFINFGLIPALYAVLWMLFHLSRYGSNEVGLSSVFFFSLIGLELTMLTMSAIPYFVMHFLNNFMLSLRVHGLMGLDSTTYYVVASWIIFVILFVVLYVMNKHADKVLS